MIAAIISLTPCVSQGMTLRRWSRVTAGEDVGNHVECGVWIVRHFFSFYLYEIMTTFVYDHLTSDQIRVLTLYPANYGDPLTGHLTTVRFAPKDGAKPEFEALSYTWGDQSNPELITLAHDRPLTGAPSLSSGVVAIGSNLVAALRQLRHASQPRQLWCDSICINQGDIQERASQVLLMGDIYTYAKRVIVWLGPESQNSHLAVETLRHAGSQLDYSSLQDDTARNMITFREDADPAFRGQGSRLPFSQDQWKAVADLLMRSWFRRLWIRQEITLANEGALVVVGDQEILWTQLLGAVSMIRSKETLPTLPASDTEIFRQSLTVVSTFRRMKAFRSLYSAISYTQECLCSDDRDRVYALLGMIDLDLAATIKPDYTLEAKDVYRDMVLKSTEHNERLAVLDFCDLAAEPTWVPDLHQRLPQGRFDYTYASGDSEAVFKTVDRNKVEAYGIECDGILERIATCADDPSEEHLRAIVRDVLFHFLGTDIETWEQDRLEALTASLVTGRTFELVEWINYRRVARTAAVFKQWARSVDVDATELVDENSALASLQEFLPGRSFSRTTAGSLVATSNHTKPGDLIYTVLGYRNTIVLRPVGAGFHVVGPSYHPRFSMGEAISGELPEGWRAVMDVGQPGPTFKKEGLLWQKQDPRMAGIELPSGWEEGEDEDGWPYWYNDGKGELVTWSDPRLRPEGLIKRGFMAKPVVLF
jgi:hypothetical protein